MSNWRLEEIIRLADKWEVDVKEIMIIAKVCRVLDYDLEAVLNVYFEGE